jgi:hypothetical protein
VLGPAIIAKIARAIVARTAVVSVAGPIVAVWAVSPIGGIGFAVGALAAGASSHEKSTGNLGDGRRGWRNHDVRGYTRSSMTARVGIQGMNLVRGMRSRSMCETGGHRS